MTIIGPEAKGGIVSIIAITGASSGLGAALTRRFASKGNMVCAIARGKERLDKIRDEHPDSIAIYPADVSDGQQVRDVFAAIEAEQGAIDVLINNAGVPSPKGGLDNYFESVSKTIDINLKGTMYCTYAVLPSMISRKRGRIINVASYAGLRQERRGPNDGTVHLGDYTASKHGMVGFGQFMARELAPHGILLSTICPGGIQTPWQKDHRDFDQLIRAEDVVNAIAFIVDQPENIVYPLVAMRPVCEFN